MPRMKKVPEPFWRSERRCWFVQIGKKQIRLDSDESTAQRLYHELMARPPQERAQPATATTGPSAFVVEILDAFLQWTQTNQAEKTYTWHRDHIQVFVSSIPKTLTVAELLPYHVSRVMDSQEWSNSTKNGFARSIQRGMNWAVEQGLIEKSPIAKLKKPTPENRELVISPEEFQRVLACFPDVEFRDLLVTVWETGCRPQEAFAVEARHVDLVHDRWVFQGQESKGKRKTRVIYLPERAAEITRRLVQKNPNGKLFRNVDGTPWDKDAVNCRFVRKKKVLGKKICLYHFRHSFAQRMLLAGVDALIVSQLLGHSNGATLARVYSHLQQAPDYLHEKLRAANLPQQT